MARKSDIDKSVSDKLDEHLLEALDELKKIVTDARHPEHKRHYFEALRLIMRHCAPVRKEMGPPDPGLTLQIGALFPGTQSEPRCEIDVTPSSIEESEEPDVDPELP
mgnify:CR=1 FL=1